MFNIQFILIIILLGITIYLVYNLYSYQTKQIEKFNEKITTSMEIEFDELNEKLDETNEFVEKKIGECNKKIKDLFSLQNKVNEVNRMNNQSIINQFHQYDEKMDGVEDPDEIKNQIFNSVENSQNNNKNNCFVKLNNVKNQDKDMFYMSSEHKKHKNPYVSVTSCSNPSLQNKLNTNLQLKSYCDSITSNNENKICSNISKDLTDSTDSTDSTDAADAAVDPVAATSVPSPPDCLYSFTPSSS